MSAFCSKLGAGEGHAGALDCIVWCSIPLACLSFAEDFQPIKVSQALLHTELITSRSHHYATQTPLALLSLSDLKL